MDLGTRDPADSSGVIYVVDGEELRHGWSPPSNAQEIAHFDPLTPAERRSATEAEASIAAALGQKAPRGAVLVDTPFERQLLVAEGAPAEEVKRLAAARAKGDDVVAFLVPRAAST